MWGGKVGSMICLWWAQRLWIYLLFFFFDSGCHLVKFFNKFIIVKIFGRVLHFLVSKAKWGTTFHRMWIHGIQILCFGWFLGFSRLFLAGFNGKHPQTERCNILVISCSCQPIIMGPILSKLLLAVKGWQTSLIFRNSSHNSSKIKSRVPTCLPNHFLGCQPQIDAKIIIGA